MSTNKGIISNIQRYTIHDGPGIRTEVFFKGCPLSCLWCSNPESINPQPELGIYPQKCIGLAACGLCLQACQMGSEKSPLLFEDQQLLGVDHTRCAACFRCVDACSTKALKAWGELMSADEILAEVLKDRSYFNKSGGGITLSGGELTVQADFALELLKESKKQLLNTCIETALCTSPEVVKRLLPYTDTLITDIKCMDSKKHARYCGVGNEQILSNIKLVQQAGIPLIIRIPIVPGINDDESNIRATAAFIRDTLGNQVLQVQLLPYRKLGLEKYESLSRPYPMPANFKDIERSQREENLKALAELMREEYGTPAVAGSNSPLSP